MKYNRAMFRFNDRVVDRWLLKPVAKAYKKSIPVQIRGGISNFFSNLGEPLTITTSLLQGKWSNARDDSARFLLNTTVGMVGFFDVATNMGLERHDEDFGQTLRRWGIAQGPYFVLPFLGPSTVLDAFTLFPDRYFDPTTHIDEDATSIGLSTVEVVNLRSELLESEAFIKGDRYIFLREAYLQRRNYQTFEQAAIEEDPFLEDEEAWDDL